MGLASGDGGKVSNGLVYAVRSVSHPWGMGNAPGSVSGKADDMYVSWCDWRHAVLTVFKTEEPKLEPIFKLGMNKGRRTALIVSSPFARVLVLPQKPSSSSLQPGMLRAVAGGSSR